MQMEIEESERAGKGLLPLKMADSAGFVSLNFGSNWTLLLSSLSLFEAVKMLDQDLKVFVV